MAMIVTWAVSSGRFVMTASRFLAMVGSRRVKSAEKIGRWSVVGPYCAGGSMDDIGWGVDVLVSWYILVMNECRWGAMVSGTMDCARIGSSVRRSWRIV